MDTNLVLRQQLLQLLNGGNAHMSFDDAVADFPMELINSRPPNVPYTFWHLIEHIRLAQFDILDFINNQNYVNREWPREYWPEADAEASTADWQRSIAQFREDQQELIKIVSNKDINLYADLEYASGYPYLREILIVADHNAYHIGELGILRQVMNAWPDPNH